MVSRNFSAYPDSPQADAWGQNAEALLEEHPDLSLVRQRQMVELLVRVVEHRSSQRFGGDLANRITSLARAGVLRSLDAQDLHWVRRKANDALHVAGLRPVGPGAWDRDAASGLERTARAWARVHEVAGFAFEAPAGARREGRELRSANALLDRAEEAVEAQRDWDGAAELLAQIDEDKLARAGVTQQHLDLIRLRKTSIRLGLSNHRGLPAAPTDGSLVKRVLESGDAAGIDEVVHLLNREAVACLDGRMLQDALQKVDELQGWREASEEFRPEHLAGVPARDWQLGALLGTRGLILAHLGHAERSADRLRGAMDCFAAAVDRFANPEDRHRQVNCRRAALVELARLGLKLDAAEQAELERAAEAPPLKALEGVPWTSEAFEVALALKAARQLDLRPRWLEQLGQTLAGLSDSDAPLSHPYERIVGGLLLALPSPPRRLRRRLQATAEADSLPAWVASMYLAQLDSREAPPPPPSLADWWSRYDLGTRSVEEGPLSALAMNYL